MVLIKQSCNAVAAAWESKKFAWQGFIVGNEIHYFKFQMFVGNFFINHSYYLLTYREEIQNKNTLFSVNVATDRKTSRAYCFCVSGIFLQDSL